MYATCVKVIADIPITSKAICTELCVEYVDVQC